MPRSLLIVDDEAPARERLERLVAELPGWNVAGSCGSGLDAIDQVQSLQPTVVLLDIRMPGMNGIEVARHLGNLENPPGVLFTTAYDEYALEAFDSRAIGYLLKPVRRERLAEALDHAVRLSESMLRSLGQVGSDFAQREHIAVRVRDDLQLIPLGAIQYFRADQKYVTVRHTGGEELVEESLKSLEAEFARSFVRIHRSILVAVAHVDALIKGDDGRYQIRIRSSGETLPVSRRQISELKARLAGGR
jgi:two-component system response regulator AlgR